LAKIINLPVKKLGLGKRHTAPRNLIYAKIFFYSSFSVSEIPTIVHAEIKINRSGSTVGSREHYPRPLATSECRQPDDVPLIVFRLPSTTHQRSNLRRICHLSAEKLSLADLPCLRP